MKNGSSAALPANDSATIEMSSRHYPPRTKCKTNRTVSV
jgi:hypothetical protein